MKTHRLALLLLALLPLAVFGAAEEQSTVIESDGPGEMISTDTETTITFRDNVRVTGTGIKLTCDFLKVIVLRTGDKSAAFGKIEKFRSMLATGNVQIVQPLIGREAACGRAEVLPEEEKIVLTEHPVVVMREEGFRQEGEKITILKNQRQVLVDKPVLIGPPVKDLGFDPNKKPETPATAAPKQP